MATPSKRPTPPEPWPSGEVAWAVLKRWFKSLQSKLCGLAEHLEETIGHLHPTTEAHYHAYATRDYLEALTAVKSTVDISMKRTRGVHLDNDSIKVTGNKFKKLELPAHMEDMIVEEEH